MPGYVDREAAAHGADFFQTVDSAHRALQDPRRIGERRHVGQLYEATRTVCSAFEDRLPHDRLLFAATVPIALIELTPDLEKSDSAAGFINSYAAFTENEPAEPLRKMAEIKIMDSKVYHALLVELQNRMQLPQLAIPLTYQGPGLLRTNRDGTVYALSNRDIHLWSRDHGVAAEIFRMFTEMPIGIFSSDERQEALARLRSQAISHPIMEKMLGHDPFADRLTTALTANQPTYESARLLSDIAVNMPYHRVESGGWESHYRAVVAAEDINYDHMDDVRKFRESPAFIKACAMFNDLLLTGYEAIPDKTGNADTLDGLLHYALPIVDFPDLPPTQRHQLIVNVPAAEAFQPGLSYFADVEMKTLDLAPHGTVLRPGQIRHTINKLVGSHHQRRTQLADLLRHPF